MIAKLTERERALVVLSSAASTPTMREKLDPDKIEWLIENMGIIVSQEDLLRLIELGESVIQETKDFFQSYLDAVKKEELTSR